MALINCPECGGEISDTASKCPHCGYTIKSIGKSILANKKKFMTAAILILVFVCVALAIKIIIRPNIKMDDFNVKNGKIATVLFLGIPTEIDGDEWRYSDCGIEFYNIPVKNISYDVSKGSYSLLFDGRYNDNLKNIIKKYCDYSGYTYLFSEYTYKELEILVDYDVVTWVSVE